MSGEPLRSISFVIKNKMQQIEFKATGIDDQNFTEVVKTFTGITTEDLAFVPAEAPINFADTLLKFLPKNVREDLPDHPENALYQETGVKYRRDKTNPEEWIPAYRTRYTCTNHTCKQRGTHFIPASVKKVKCHNCREELDVRDASPEGFPNKDEYNNFFFAGDGA